MGQKTRYGYKLDQTGQQTQDLLDVINNKVDKVDGKGLSANDFTDADKAKLDGIQAGAEANVQADWSQNTPSADDYVRNRTHWEDNGEVHKLDNKYIDMDLAPTAQSGKPVTSGGVKAAISNFITRSVNDLANYYLKSETYTKAEVESLIGAIQHFHYEIYPNLESVTHLANNILYLIGPTGSGTDKYEEYVYDSTKTNPWVKIGDTSIDLSGYVTTEALNTALGNYVTSSALATTLANYVTSSALTTALAAKQDALVSGENIKTVNGQSILGSGNIPIEGASDAVKYTSQTLTGAQKTQARTNIAAASDAEVSQLRSEIDNVRGTYPDIEGEARNKWYLDSVYRYQDVSASAPGFTGSMAIYQIDGASSVVVDIPMVYIARAVAFDNAIPQSGVYAAAHQDLPANQAYSGTLTNPGNYKYLILCYATANGIPTVKGGTRVGGSEEALAIAKELQADAKLNIISVDDLYVAKGARQKFYYNTFIHARENAYGNILDGFSVDAACTTASIGTTDEEGFEIYCATNGDYVVNFTVMDLSQNVVAAFSINVHVRDANNLTGKNILMVGDSWTDPSFYNPTQYPTGKGYAVNAAIGLKNAGSVANFVGSKFAGDTDIYCEGRGGWAWTTYVGSSSPFYNNGSIDFSHYRSQIGLAENFDYVSFQLGVNDCLGNRKSTADWQITLEAITTLINAVLADSPSCKIIINPVGLDAPGNTGWTSLNGLSVNKHIYQANAYDLSALIHDLVTAREDYGTKVFMGQSYFGVNRWYGYGYIDGRKRFFKVDTASMSAADLATLEGWDFKTNPKYMNNGQKEWHVQGYQNGYLIAIDQCKYRDWNSHVQEFVNQYSVPQDTTPSAGSLTQTSGTGLPTIPFTACYIENNDLLSHYFMNATHPYDYGFTQLGRCLANQLLVI